MLNGKFSGHQEHIYESLRYPCVDNKNNVTVNINEVSDHLYNLRKEYVGDYEVTDFDLSKLKRKRQAVKNGVNLEQNKKFHLGVSANSDYGTSSSNSREIWPSSRESWMSSRSIYSLENYPTLNSASGAQEKGSELVATGEGKQGDGVGDRAGTGRASEAEPGVCTEHFKGQIKLKFSKEFSDDIIVTVEGIKDLDDCSSPQECSCQNNNNYCGQVSKGNHIRKYRLEIGIQLQKSNKRLSGSIENVENFTFDYNHQTSKCGIIYNKAKQLQYICNQSVSQTFKPGKEDKSKKDLRLVLSLYRLHLCSRQEESKMTSETYSSARDQLIGCMSFGLKHLIKKLNVLEQVHNGWYYLLDRSIGYRKHIQVKTELCANQGSQPLESPEILKSFEFSPSNFDNQTKEEPHIHSNNHEYQHLYNHHMYLTIPSTEHGYGFTIRGPAPCKISKVKAGSAAESARLMTSDVVIEINNNDVTEWKAADVAKLVRDSVIYPELRLKIARTIPISSKLSVKDSEEKCSSRKRERSEMKRLEAAEKEDSPFDTGDEMNEEDKENFNPNLATSAAGGKCARIDSGERSQLAIPDYHINPKNLLREFAQVLQSTPTPVRFGLKCNKRTQVVTNSVEYKRKSSQENSTEVLQNSSSFLYEKLRVTQSNSGVKQCGANIEKEPRNDTGYETLNITSIRERLEISRKFKNDTKWNPDLSHIINEKMSPGNLKMISNEVGSDEFFIESSQNPLNMALVEEYYDDDDSAFGGSNAYCLSSYTHLSNCAQENSRNKNNSRNNYCVNYELESVINDRNNNYVTTVGLNQSNSSEDDSENILSKRSPNKNFTHEVFHNITTAKSENKTVPHECQSSSEYSGSFLENPANTSVENSESSYSVIYDNNSIYSRIESEYEYISEDASGSYLAECVQERTETALNETFLWVEEVLRLEKEYVNLMCTGVQTFCQPIRNRLLSANQHRALFQNIEKILAVSKLNISLLEGVRRMKEPDSNNVILFKHLNKSESALSPRKAFRFSQTPISSQNTGSRTVGDRCLSQLHKSYQILENLTQKYSENLEQALQLLQDLMSTNPKLAGYFKMGSSRSLANSSSSGNAAASGNSPDGKFLFSSPDFCQETQGQKELEDERIVECTSDVQEDERSGCTLSAEDFMIAPVVHLIRLRKILPSFS